jgi:hypothetical protein
MADGKPFARLVTGLEGGGVGATVGETTVERGLRATMGGGGTVGSPKVVSRGGSSCWLTNRSGNRNFVMMDVDDAFLRDADTTTYLTVRYFDAGGGKFTVQHDSRADVEDPEWQTNAVVDVGDSGSWKTHTFELERSRFAGQQAHSQDIRLGIWAPNMGTSSADVCFSAFRLSHSQPDDTLTPFGGTITPAAAQQTASPAPATDADDGGDTPDSTSTSAPSPGVLVTLVMVSLGLLLARRRP